MLEEDFQPLFESLPDMKDQLSTNGEKPTGETSRPSGMTPEIMDLYEGLMDPFTSKYLWLEYCPPHYDAPVEGEMTTHYALLVRHKQSLSNRKKTELLSIVIQSPLLRHALVPVFEGYPGTSMSLERQEFTPSFKPFVCRRSRLRSALNDEKEPDTKEHLELLIEVLHTELEDTLKARDECMAKNVIAFDLLWTIYEPGSIIRSTDGALGHAYRLIKGDYGRQGFVLSCSYADGMEKALVIGPRAW